MGRDQVKVCVRTRPTSTFAQDAIVIDKEAQVLEKHISKHRNTSCSRSTTHSPRGCIRSFKYTQVVNDGVGGEAQPST
ncbi:unnamed protein product [Ectocarpus sp. 13 AM-2016]